MRHFIRHPTTIPIEVSCADQHVAAEPQILNLSYGGLAFQSAVELPLGLVVEVRIPSVRQFVTCGRVAWCKSGESGFQLGITFLDPEEAFRTRMVEQICHIESYREMILNTEGRDLSAEKAAMEWIDKFAAQFPRVDVDAEQ